MTENQIPDREDLGGSIIVAIEIKKLTGGLNIAWYKSSQYLVDKRYNGPTQIKILLAAADWLNLPYLEGTERKGRK